MAGWHHRLNGHGFGKTLGVGDGQGGKERDGRSDTLCKTPYKALSSLISSQQFLIFAKAETAAHLMHSFL